MSAVAALPGHHLRSTQQQQQQHHQQHQPLQQKDQWRQQQQQQQHKEQLHHHLLQQQQQQQQRLRQKHKQQLQQHWLELQQQQQQEHGQHQRRHRQQQQQPQQQQQQQRQQQQFDQRHHDRHRNANHRHRQPPPPAPPQQQQPDHNRNHRVQQIDHQQQQLQQQQQQRHQQRAATPLPSAFVESLRPLFAALDDGGRGAVHVAEIESRWGGRAGGGGAGGAGGVGGGVLAALRRAASPGGHLTFERFAAGLGRAAEDIDATESAAPAVTTSDSESESSESASSPPPLTPSSPAATASATSSAKTTAASSSAAAAAPTSSSSVTPAPWGSRLRPASGGGAWAGSGSAVPWERRTSLAARSLQSLDGVDSAGPPPPPPPPSSPPPPLPPPPLGPRLLNPAAAGAMRVMGRSHSDSSTAMAMAMVVGEADTRRNKNSARGEHRRHTITGLDHHTVEAVHQQQEALGSALRALDTARVRVQDEVTGRGRRDAGVATGYGVEVNPARVAQIYHRIQEATRILADVTESAKGGGDRAGPPATQGPPTAGPSAGVLQQALCVLRDQNRLLTREVSEKSERISQLEREKSLLIQQLFEARSRNHGNASLADSTFI